MKSPAVTIVLVSALMFSACTTAPTRHPLSSTVADGTHYAVRINNDTVFQFETGKDYTVEGYFKEDLDSIYDIEGSILLTNLK